MKIFLLIIIVIINSYSSNGYLRVNNTQLYYNNEKVFLSGANIPWVAYGRDFGRGAYNQWRPKFEQAIDQVGAAGGNTIRVWVHIDGQWSPQFDANGYATGADTNSLINELGTLLDHAAQRNVFVILCLWNLAVKPQQMIHLYTDEPKLNSYLDKVLKPLANGLKNKPALAAYDIINEPAGSHSQGVADPNPCFDTMILRGTGTDWTGSHLHLKDVLRFINLHADAIKSVDPKALVTVGDGEQTSTAICGNCREYLGDHCLITAGGKPKGTLDFYQLHSYRWQGKYPDTSPFLKRNSDYKSSKPLVVGEFSSICKNGQDALNEYKHLYESEYAGGLSWGYSDNDGGQCPSKRTETDAGMSSIKDMTSNGKIKIKI